MIQANDKERYIYNYLNSKSSTLSFYVPRILNANASDEELNNYINRVISLITEIKMILKTLEIDEIPINQFFNELYKLSLCNISEVNELLEFYNYSNVLDKGYVDILREITLRRSMRGKNKLCAEFLIANDLVEDQELVYEHFINNILLKTPDIDYSTFELVMVKYAKFKMKQYVTDPKCEILSEQELNGMQSYAFKDTIYLCREDLQLMYSSGVFKALKNMFHELGHIKQYKEIIIDQNSSPYVIKQIKEEILSSFYPGYYENNYAKISFEAEAEIFSITELLKLFNKFGINFKKGQNPYLSTINKIISEVNDNNRYIDGVQDDLNEVFDFLIIHHPELLSTYPQLQEEYEISFGDLVVRKDDFGRRD